MFHTKLISHLSLEQIELRHNQSARGDRRKETSLSPINEIESMSNPSIKREIDTFLFNLLLLFSLKCTGLFCEKKAIPTSEQVAQKKRDKLFFGSKVNFCVRCLILSYLHQKGYCHNIFFWRPQTLIFFLFTGKKAQEFIQDSKFH